MNGRVPVFEKSTRSVHKFSLNLSDDGDCNFIRRFCPDIQPNGGMYPMNIFSLELKALCGKFDQHLIKALARSENSNIWCVSLYELLQYIPVVFIVMGHQHAGGEGCDFKIAVNEIPMAKRKFVGRWKKKWRDMGDTFIRYLNIPTQRFG